MEVMPRLEMNNTQEPEVERDMWTQARDVAALLSAFVLLSASFCSYGTDSPIFLVSSSQSTTSHWQCFSSAETQCQGAIDILQTESIVRALWERAGDFLNGLFPLGPARPASLSGSASLVAERLVVVIKGQSNSLLQPRDVQRSLVYGYDYTPATSTRLATSPAST